MPRTDISQKLSRTGWRSFKASELNEFSLDALFNNEIPCIVVPGFASNEECRRMESAVTAVGFSDYQQVDPPIGRIGVTQFEANKTDKAWYFGSAPQATNSRELVSNRSFDAIARVIQNLSCANGTTNVGIAWEPGFGSYFAGLIRRINASALIHSDYAPFDAPGWSIGNINSQLAWNVYLRLPSHGGECIVYNRQWDQEAEAFRIPGSYGYRPALVDDVECKVIKPAVGDLVLFNSRNFHEVTIGSGDRLSVSSFIGRMPNGEIVLWS